MELLYNPDSMPEEEIKATFVARQRLIDEFVSMIERQPDGAGVQHVLIIAPRGMGKTTVLLMVKFGIKDCNLASRWQAVKFPEESYGVYDLSDFWLEVLNIIAADTDDDELRKRAESLKEEYPDNEDLQEAALAMIKDWRREHDKRLVLLVDNFDMILEQINDERDNARLREVLMNDGTMMVIGCAVSYFREIRDYNQPLYNFFKTYDLANLRFEQMQELLRRRAEMDGRENFEEKLKANASRLRVLEYFTGGNPRLVLMLYRVVTQSDISEVKRGLEKLLDEVTPYFKSKVETLPAQQRKILDHIARISAKTNEGLTPTEIAAAVRLSANQVSAQLKRLSEDGYVRAANLRGRSSYYTLSEPLYAIWHQMRFGRDARERMQWLVAFLKVWYDATEMGPESTRLEMNFRQSLSAGRMREARNALEHRYFLAEAMDDSIIRANTRDGVVRGYLEMKEIEVLKKDVLPTISLADLTEDTRNALYEAGCIREQDLQKAKIATPTSQEAQKEAEFAAAFDLATASYDAGQFSEGLEHIDRAIEINPDNYAAWNNRGCALYKLGRYEEAIASYDRTIEINPNDDYAWYNRGNALDDLGRHKEAIASYDRAIEITPDDNKTWYNRGNVLSKLKRNEEAIVSYDRAIKINPDHAAWNNRGIALRKLGRHEEAIASYDRAIEITPDDDDVWYNRALTYLEKLNVLMSKGESLLAEQSWNEATASASHLQKQEWHELVSWGLTAAAQAGHLEFVREIIKESDLEEPLFPLARAIDYLMTGEDALIEKLSPEVRGIVEEVVATLRKSAKQAKSSKAESRIGNGSGSKKKSGAKKPKPGARGRTSRKLR